MGDGIGTGSSGQSANADAQQHNINVAAKNITRTGSQNEEKIEEMEFMAGMISRNQLSRHENLLQILNCISRFRRAEKEPSYERAPPISPSAKPPLVQAQPGTLSLTVVRRASLRMTPKRNRLWLHRARYRTEGPKEKQLQPPQQWRLKASLDTCFHHTEPRPQQAFDRVSVWGRLLPDPGPFAEFLQPAEVPG